MCCIIVTGGLANKGLQSMAFTTVDRLKRLFPDARIVFLAQDYREYARHDRCLYTFEVLPWKLVMKYACLNPFSYRSVKVWGDFWHKEWAEHLEQVRSLLNEAILSLDISGYALSAQWPFITSWKYLMHIAVMKKHGIKLYLLPQSFGPFNYKQPQKMILLPFLRKYLGYPARIFAREEEGIVALSRFTRDNLVKTPDLVLLSPPIDPALIYLKPPRRQTAGLEIPKGSVVIVPNTRVMEHGNALRLLEVYQHIFSDLIQSDRHIFVFWHSHVDRQVCEMLRHRCKPYHRLVYLDLDLDCLEIVDLFARFEIVLTARYHALVHAYKAGTPALVFGWSAKYREMMSLLGQERYLFDAREDIETESILAALNILLARRQDEAQVIKEKLGNLQKEYDVFSYITNSGLGGLA